jgi:hypothetical protein
MPQTELLADARTINNTATNLYSANAVMGATFLGTPLAGGYLLAQNAKALAQHGQLSRIWVGALCGFLAIVGLVLLSDNMNSLDWGLSIALAIAARIYYNKKQQAAVQQHLVKGGTYYGWGRVVGIILLFLGLGTAVVLPLTIFLEEPMDIEREELAEVEQGVAIDEEEAMQILQYGEVGHTIFYDQKQLTAEEIDALAEQLTRWDYFDADAKWLFVDVEQEDYILMIYDYTAEPESTATTQRYQALKNQLEEAFSEAAFTLYLMNEELNETLAEF